MADIYITRHGETDWNVQKIFRGHADIDLNANGRKQAEALATFLRSIKMNAIYSSPLERALRTSQIIANSQHRLRLETDIDLVDFNYGEWQGVAEEEVKEKYPDLYNRWLKEPHHVKIPGGENLNDVKKRVVRVANSIAAEHETGNILIVSHRIPLKVLILSLLGLDIAKMDLLQTDACALTCFSCTDGKWKMKQFNETCFLKGIKIEASENF
jgi:phosphoserine phosphatase